MREECVTKNLVHLKRAIWKTLSPGSSNTDTLSGQVRLAMNTMRQYLTN